MSLTFDEHVDALTTQYRAALQAASTATESAERFRAERDAAQAGEQELQQAVAARDEQIAALQARVAELEGHEARPVLLAVLEPLNFRRSPEVLATNRIRLLEAGETLVKLGEARGQAVPDRGDVWYEVQDSAGVTGWVHRAYVEVVAGEDSDSEAILPLNEGWIGFDGPGDTGDPDNPAEMEGWPYLVDDTVFRRIDVSKVPALRLHFPGTPSAVVERLKALPVEAGKPERQIRFLAGRVRCAFPADRAVSPAEHFAAVAPFVQRGVDAGVDWWSCLNEPNVPPELAPEGLGGSWTTGTGAGRWFLEWAQLFRARWPHAHLLLPAVSPGIAGHDAFWEAMVAAGALAVADGFEVHSYWTDAVTLRAEIERVVTLARRHFTKPCFVTECANVAGVSGRERARQFFEFWREVTKRTDNIEGVFWFNVFTTHPDHKASEVDLEMAETLGQLIKEEVRETT